MTIFDWLPSALLIIALWLARKAILARVSASVQHGFDHKLEVVKHEIRNREAEIAAIRQSLIDVTGSRQNAVDERKLRAVDELWKGLVALRRYGAGVANMLAPLKLDKVVTELHDPRMKTFLETVFGSVMSMEEFGKDTDLLRAQEAQPWVHPMAWATFTTYSAVVGIVLLQGHSLKVGIDPRGFFSQEKLDELVSQTFPESDIDFTHLHNAVLPIVLERLESRLLEELQLSISGDDADEETAERARRLNSLAASVIADVSGRKKGEMDQASVS